jgi:hypothetical protein
MTWKIATLQPYNRQPGPPTTASSAPTNERNIFVGAYRGRKLHQRLAIVRRYATKFSPLAAREERVLFVGGVCDVQQKTSFLCPNRKYKIWT